MKGPSGPRRAFNLAIVAVLGIALAMGGFVALQVATAPGPRPAPGWRLLAELPNPRGETAGAAMDDGLVVAGGLAGVAAGASADVSIYTSSTESWAPGPPLPEARHHAAAVALDGAVYVSGGAASVVEWSPRDTLWVLRQSASEWQELAPMPDARLGHRMVAVDGLLYVVGGVSGRSGAGAGAVDAGAVLIYDPATDARSEGAPLPLARDHLAVVVVDGEIWALGGRANGLNHAFVDIYDPDADAWRAGPPLPIATSGASEGVVDGIIYLSGGEDPGAGLIIDRHWQLDTTVAGMPTWEPLEPPPFAVHGAPGVVLGRTFVVVGGSLRAAGQSSTAWTGATQLLQR